MTPGSSSSAVQHNCHFHKCCAPRSLPDLAGHDGDPHIPKTQIVIFRSFKLPVRAKRDNLQLKLEFPELCSNREQKAGSVPQGLSMTVSTCCIYDYRWQYFMHKKNFMLCIRHLTPDTNFSPFMELQPSGCSHLDHWSAAHFHRNSYLSFVAKQTRNEFTKTNTQCKSGIKQRSGPLPSFGSYAMWFMDS